MSVDVWVRFTFKTYDWLILLSVPAGGGDEVRFLVRCSAALVFLKEDGKVRADLQAEFVPNWLSFRSRSRSFYNRTLNHLTSTFSFGGFIK